MLCFSKLCCASRHYLASRRQRKQLDLVKPNPKNTIFVSSAFLHGEVFRSFSFNSLAPGGFPPEAVPRKECFSCFHLVFSFSTTKTLEHIQVFACNNGTHATTSCSQTRTAQLFSFTIERNLQRVRRRCYGWRAAVWCFTARGLGGCGAGSRETLLLSLLFHIPHAAFFVLFLFVHAFCLLACLLASQDGKCFPVRSSP